MKITYADRLENFGGVIDRYDLIYHYILVNFFNLDEIQAYCDLMFEKDWIKGKTVIGKDLFTTKIYFKNTEDALMVRLKFSDRILNHG